MHPECQDKKLALELTPVETVGLQHLTILFSEIE